MNRLRIALVAEALDTGLAQLVYLLAGGLDRRGHDVHLLHSRDRTDPEFLHRLRDQSGVRCRAIDMVRSVHRTDFTACLTIRRYLKDQGPFDIVHGHSSKGGALARLAGIGLPGARIYTPHAFYTLSPDLAPATRFAFRSIERALAQLCATVICSSALERRHAELLGIAAKRLAIVPNAIEPPIIAPAARDRFGFGPGDFFIVGFVGRLEHQKAPDILLKAAAQAAKKNSALRLVMIGDGHLEGSLKALSASLGMGDRVAWLGRQPSVHYLASFDMLAMPSRYEGFSLMPLEAMYASLPIVCTPVGGIAEAVLDGVTGLIVPIDDTEALSAAILAVANDPRRRRVLGDTARDRADLFLPDRLIAATEKIYLEALDRAAPAEAGNITIGAAAHNIHRTPERIP